MDGLRHTGTFFGPKIVDHDYATWNQPCAEILQTL
jgi:hypothetical protein